MAHDPEKECLSGSSNPGSHYSETTNFSLRLLNNADHEDRDELYPESPDLYRDEGYFSDSDSPPPPDPGIETIKFASTPASVIHGRKAAAEILSLCRTMLTTLELTRMRKARIGLQYWTGFWHRIYKAPLSDDICYCVREMYPKMDEIFKITAEHIMKIIAIAEERIARAQSEGEIAVLLRQMELQIKQCVEIRQINAQIIFETMRLNFERIPVDVGDEMYDDLKRGIFALDSDGNYHPGDPVAEEKDKHVGRPLWGGGYISNQPDLLFRPGFTGEFQEALADASNATMTTVDEGYEDTNSTELMEEGDSPCGSMTVEYPSPFET